MSEANKAIVRRYFEEVFNKKVVAVLDDLIAPTFVGHTSTGTDVQGPEGVKQQVALFSAAFPDMHYTLEDLVAEGDKVVARFTFRGGALRGKRQSP
jgi:predicted ester cyclase